MEKFKVESVSILYVERYGIYGGYKDELLKEEIPSYFKGFVICNRCEGIMRDASGIGDPQVFMCESCAQGERINPLTSNREVINNLIIWCPLKSRGCEWEGNISSSETHLDTCVYLYKECDISCGAVVRRIDMESHVNGECPLRKIMCEHCTQSHKQTDMALHLGECAMFPLQCTNGCGHILPRGDMQSHREEVCPHFLLECDYRKYGCSVELMRKELDTHTTEHRLQHMEMVLQTGIKSLREELERVKEENNSIKGQIALLMDENLSHRNAVCTMYDDYATLKHELVSLINSTNDQYDRLEIIHNEFVRDRYNPLVHEVEKIKPTNTHLEKKLTAKISAQSLLPLITICKDLEYLSLLQERRTFNLSRIFLKRLKCVSEIREGLRSDPVRLLGINHEPIEQSTGSLVVRLTGIYSISFHCNATINLCVVLMNYFQDRIQNTYCFSIVIKPEVTRSDSDLSIQPHAWKSKRYEKTYILADIPIADIQKEEVCNLDSINIRICYDRSIDYSV